MMKILRQILFLSVFMIGFSLTATAQKQDDKKTPPKENRPTIRVEDKKGDKPKDDKRNDDRKNEDRKKPDLAFLKVSSEVEEV